MKTTTNLGLKKPENSDYVDVSVINENMDKLDEAVPSAAENALKAAATKDAPADNDGFPVVDSADSNKVKRVLWSKIKALFAPAAHAAQHGSAGSDPVTPADIGAVSKTGDTMTGDLQMISGNALSFHASDADWNSSPWFSLMRQNHGLKLTVRNKGLNRLFYFNDNTEALKDALTLWYYDDGSEHKATFLHTGNLSEYNMDWVSVWPVPFSYDGLTVFTISNVEKVVTLPEPIDCSKYYYDFRITVYGLMRKGDTKNTSILADVELVYNTSTVDGETIYAGTKLTSLTTTEATEDLASDLSWASIYRKEIETLPPNGFLTSIGEGSKGGVIKTYGQDYSITTSDLLGAKVYDKLLITFGTVSSNAAIQTFGIKFEYRKTRKKG